MDMDNIEIKSTADLDKICRFCLKENSGTFNLLNLPKIQLRITDAADLKIHSNDGLPKSICQLCRIQLERSYVFRKRCHQSDIKLRKHLGLTNSDKKISFDMKESLTFLALVDKEEKETNEKKWKNREKQMMNKIRAKEIEHLFDEFKSFINMKSQNDYVTIASLDCGEEVEESIVSKENTEEKTSIIYEEDDSQDNLIYVVEEYDETDEKINYEHDFENNSRHFEDEQNDRTINELLDEQDYEKNEDEEVQIDEDLQIDNEIDCEDPERLEDYKLTKVEKHVKDSKTKNKIYTSESNLKVEICLDKNNLENQTDQEKKENLKIFKCTLCPQSFTTRLLLARHNSVHLKNKKYSCNDCKKWFACKSSLVRHSRVHTGEKPFECTECGKKFIQKEILKRHMHLHTGDKPFKCSHCDRAFVQKQVLQKHIDIKHTENPVIKLHDCHLCIKSFMHASGLSRHLILHSGISFNCSTCSKQFTDKSALKRHEYVCSRS